MCMVPNKIGALQQEMRQNGVAYHHPHASFFTDTFKNAHAYIKHVFLSQREIKVPSCCPIQFHARDVWDHMQSSFSDQLCPPGFLSSTATSSMSTQDTLSRVSFRTHQPFDDISLMPCPRVTIFPSWNSSVLSTFHPAFYTYPVSYTTYQGQFWRIPLPNTKLSSSLSSGSLAIEMDSGFQHKEILL